MKATECITELIKILSQDSSFFEEISDLRREKERIEKNVIRVGVIGVTSSGKSTMLNSLLGEKLLPAEAKPSSSQLVSCCKGAERCARIFLDDGRILQFQGHKLSSNIVSKFGNENENRNNKEHVRQIQLISPYLPVAPNVELVDSPGLDAYGLEGHERITMENLLPTVDFCIYVTTCKTNSDEKMRFVLDSIARSKKPVIIIQNMIDSLKGSLDGKKSKNDVAKEHAVRIQRVVERSDIIDKTSVHIIQISAIYALACRMVLIKGKQLNKEGIVKWKESGFEALEKLLKEIPLRLADKMETSRLQKILSTIRRISDQVKVIGSSAAPVVDTHNYEHDFDLLLSKIKSRGVQIISSINAEISNLDNRRIYSESRIDDIKRKHQAWTDEVVAVMQMFNKGVKPIYKGLGMSERDVRFSFIPSQQVSLLRVQTKIVTKEVKQKGFGGWLKRVFTFGSCGYETITETQSDWSTTTQKIIEFLRNCKADYSNQLNGWIENVMRIRGAVEEAMNTKRRLNEEARKRHLDNEKKRQILTQLKSLADRIPVSRLPKDVKGLSSHTYNMRRYEKRMPLIDFYSYVHTRQLILTLQHKCFSYMFGGRNLSVYSWDRPSLNLFLSMCAGIPSAEISKMQTGKAFNGITICDANATGRRADRFLKVVFVNLTQPGAAKKQIANLLSTFTDIYRGEYVFVIQDLQEVINGNDLKNALCDMHDFIREKLRGASFRWYALHSNPLYSAALIEIQKRDLQTQNDEVVLGGELRRTMERFYDEETANNINTLMRAFSK